LLGAADFYQVSFELTPWSKATLQEFLVQIGGPSGCTVPLFQGERRGLEGKGIVVFSKERPHIEWISH